MIKLFLDNFEVLATHPIQYGETEVLEMKIDLFPGVILYKSWVRPLNPDQKENLRDQIDEWLDQGVIEPSISPWASLLVPVKKKDGQMRWVTDLRELNKQTVKNSYPLTNIQEILHSLKGATVFLSLDACGAYHAVRIEPGSCACTAFISPFGTFQNIWISQRGKHLQQDVVRGHEGCGQRILDLISRWYIDVQRRTLDSLQAFGSGGTSTCGCRDKATTLQDKVVPIWGGVLRTQDQQGQSFDDPRVCVMDQGLACTKEWQGSSHILRICRILPYLHPPVFSVDK